MMHSIYMVSTKPKSKKMVSTINSYTKALVHIYIYVYVYIYICIYIYIYIYIWKRSFGDLHVTSKSSVTNKLQKLVNLHRKSEKHKNKECWKVFKTTQ